MRNWLILFHLLVLPFSVPVARSQTAAATTQPAPAPSKNPESEAKLARFTGPDGRFSIMMPGTPQFETQQIQLKNSTTTVPLNQFFVEMESNNISYMLMYTDYPPNAANGEPTTLLQRFVTGAVQGKTLVTQNSIALGNVPGVAFTARDSDNYFYDVRYYFVNKRLYQLILTSGPGYTPKFRDAFFNSFAIK